MLFYLTPDELDRFWSKIDRDGPIPEHCPELGNCWVFTGGLSHGYGQFTFYRNGKPRCFKTHQISWMLHFGEIPDDPMCVLHRCDNPPCGRPDHLFLGTRTDNANDRTAKGRSRNGAMSGVWKGERVTNSRFTETDVLEIRSCYQAGESQHALARRFNTRQGTIANIIARRSWKHLS